MMLLISVMCLKRSARHSYGEFYCFSYSQSDNLIDTFAVSLFICNQFEVIWHSNIKQAQFSC